ncbi:ATP-dependent RNA helicase RhlE [Betaproteobacteria bacterium]|nr:ATP-dependent RNA helicase RhlE [Betaproteobacteria bacterium]
MTFAELGLHEILLNTLNAAAYRVPTPVQEQTIPAALAGYDLMVSSQTGSGKTAAFMLPALHRFIEQERSVQTTQTTTSSRTLNQERQSARARGKDRSRFQPAQPRMLVLAPTRELALQVTAAADKYAGPVRRLKAVSILGGMPYPKQMELLARNPEILVATPGRLIDHMTSGKIDFSRLQILVLDEADRMLDMGFIEDIEKIAAATPTSRQTLLFSATLDGAVGRIARQVTRDAQVIQVDTPQTKHENIEQRLHFVDDLKHKNRLLDHLLRDANIDQAIVFTATKRDADTICDRLNIAGFNAAALHGDMPQRFRNRTLDAMRRGQVRILVATDVAARGLDVPTITHVFNYDLPKFAEDYVHRIGRTGRAGHNGLAISLVNHAEHFNIRKIERFTRQLIPVEVVVGHEPVRPAPTSRGRPGEKTGGKFSANGKPGNRHTHNAGKPGESRGNGKLVPASRNHAHAPEYSGKPGTQKTDGAPASYPHRDNQKKFHKSKSGDSRHAYGYR